MKAWQLDGLGGRLSLRDIPMSVVRPGCPFGSKPFTNPTDAYRKAWYPGASQSRPQTVRFESKDYFEVLRAIRFIM